MRSFTTFVVLICCCVAAHAFFLQSVAAGPSYWFSMWANTEKCGSGLLVQNHSGVTPVMSTWLSSQTFNIEMQSDTTFFISNSEFLIANGTGLKWYLLRNSTAAYPFNKGLVAANISNWYDPRTDPNALWIFSNGAFSDPSGTVFLGLMSPDPAEQDPGWVQGCTSYITSPVLFPMLLPATHCYERLCEWHIVSSN